MKNVKTPITALIVIIAILLLWNHGSKNSIHEQTQDDQQQGQDIFKRHARRNGPVTLSDLRYAYTGNWQKNNIVAEAGQFAFPTPAVVKAAAAAKKAAAKKADAKKIAAKKSAKYRYYTGPSPKFTSPTADSNINGGPANVLPTNPPVTPSATPPTDAKKTAQDYLKQIIASKNISQLVNDFKSHKTDAATFYSVINTLLAPTDVDPTIRILAYQAMGQVSPSMQSFSIIANHKSFETTGNVQQAAQSDLNAYANINYIPTMNALLGNNSDSVRIAAAQVIQTVVTQVLGVGANNNHGGTVAAQQYAQLFNSVLVNLNNLLQSGRLDSQVSSAFSSARNTLQQFLG